MGRFEKAVAVITLILAFIPAYFQFFSDAPTEVSMIIFGAAMAVVIFIFSLDYFIEIIKDRISQLESLIERVKKLEEKLDYKDMVSDLDKRLSILEDRKGAVDPRIVALIVLAVLVVLYLRSVGVF